MRVIPLTDRDRIRGFLRTDRFFADYALGDLDPAHFPFTEWFGAEEDDELCALVMVYHDLRLPLVFALGAGRGVERILAQRVHFPQIEISLREEQLPVVERFYRADPAPMLKMALEPEDRSRVSEFMMKSEMERRNLVAVTRLDVSHVPLLEELYSHGGGDAFRQRALELGVFYGVFDAERLVSVAGTHIVSDNERIAALGNVMTHPGYRGRGLATLATGAVCEALLQRGIELIGLSVSRSNEAAIRVYEKIGFIRRVPFFEGTAVSKEE